MWILWKVFDWTVVSFSSKLISWSFREGTESLRKERIKQTNNQTKTPRMNRGKDQAMGFPGLSDGWMTGCELMCWGPWLGLFGQRAAELQTLRNGRTYTTQTKTYHQSFFNEGKCHSSWWGDFFQSWTDLIVIISHRSSCHLLST